LTNLNLECTKLDEEKNKLSRQINKKLKIADSYLAEQNEIKSLANPIAGIYGFSNALESSCHEYVSLRKIKKRANNLKKEYFKKRVPKELTLKVTLVMQEKSQSEAKELSEFLELALISKPSAREDICLDWNEKLDGIFDSFEKIINSN
jgi:phosphoenolpyruvate synthase/pyruvate phosphate dikinase